MHLTPALKVTSLSKDGPAELAGVRVGDIVTKVNHRPVKTLVDYVDVWQRPHAIRI